MKTESKTKKEGIPCRILSGLVSIPFLFIPILTLINLFKIIDLGNLGIILLFEAVVFSVFGCEFASVALRGKTFFLYKLNKTQNDGTSDSVSPPES
jgi:hypothetical protein